MDYPTTEDYYDSSDYSTILPEVWKNEEWETLVERIFIFIQYIHLSAGLFEIAAQIFVIAMILINKKIKTKTNMSLLHLTAIGSLYYCSSMVIGLLWLLHISCECFRPLHFIEYLIQLEGVLLIIYVISASLMAFHWLLSALKSNIAPKYERLEKHIHFFVYLIGVILYFSPAIFHINLPTWRMLIVNTLCIICSVLVIILNVLKFKLKPVVDNSHTEYFFFVPNIVIFSMVPFLITLLMFYLNTTYSFVFVYYLLNFILYVLWLTHPLIVLYKLVASNEEFKRAFRGILRCSSGYIDDLDGGNINENYVVRYEKTNGGKEITS